MTTPPPEKLETQNAETLRVVPFQFLISLLHFPSGWRAKEQRQVVNDAAALPVSNR
jgi:hypothetical protein